MAKRIVSICAFLLVIVFTTIACNKGEIAATPFPTDTATPIPTITSTTTPAPTDTAQPTITTTFTAIQSATSTVSPTNSVTPTMTPFPTLDYVVEYPFDTTGMSTETQYEELIGLFMYAFIVENSQYDLFGLGPNPNFNGFPSTHTLLQDGYVDQLG